MTAFRLFRAGPLGLAAAFALSLSPASTQAWAQTPTNAGPPPGPPGMHGPDGQMREQMREHWREGMEQRRAARLADWTTVLKLTPSQAQALQTAMMRPRREERSRGDHNKGEMANETTLQRLDRMQARMGDRQERMRRHLAAMRAFYTSLSPDQQKSFDALSRLTHGGGGGHHHGMWGGHHGMSATGGPGGPGMRRGPPPSGD